MPAQTTAALRDLDRRHHFHPFTNHLRMRERGARIITSADGVHVTDSDGARYLDMMSGLWCVNIGYGRAELARAAAAQMETLPYYNSFFQTAQAPAVQLAEALAEVTPPQYRLAFFGTSGSDANDTNMRLARYYWQLRGEPKRHYIISRENAYHGSTVAAASLGGMAAMHAQGGLPIPGIRHIAQPDYFSHRANGGELSEQDFARKTAHALEEKIIELGAERVAAFIAEPIQGAGGVIIPPPGYWEEIQRICNAHEILLIVDEVICGFGRTGEWFGSDALNIRGDLMTLAKGLTSGYQPLSAVMVSDRVSAALEHDREFSHGYTYSGHPVACAVALENINILRRENLIETARENVMQYLHAALHKLGAHELVGEARITGFIGALELVADKKTSRRFPPGANAGTLCRDFCFDNGLVMRAVGDTMVLSPPLIITRGDVDEFAQKAEKSLTQTLRALGKVS